MAAHPRRSLAHVDRRVVGQAERLGDREVEAGGQRAARGEQDLHRPLGALVGADRDLAVQDHAAARVVPLGPGGGDVATEEVEDLAEHVFLDVVVAQDGRAKAADQRGEAQLVVRVEADGDVTRLLDHLAERADVHVAPDAGFELADEHGAAARRAVATEVPVPRGARDDLPAAGRGVLQAGPVGIPLVDLFGHEPGGGSGQRSTKEPQDQDFLHDRGPVR